MKNDGIPSDFFAKVIGLMIVVTLLSVFKINISNKIYQRSREINRLNMEVVALKEERSILSMNIEKLSYKTEVLDTIEIEKRENDSDIPQPKGLTPQDIKKLFGGREQSVIEENGDATESEAKPQQTPQTLIIERNLTKKTLESD